MRVAFYIPPPAAREGGLDVAIASMATEIPGDGFQVEVEPAHASEFDLVHFHGLWQPRFASLAEACRRAGQPYVVSPHGMLEPWAWWHRWWKKWPYFFLRERRWLNRAAALLATSPLEARHLRRFRMRPAVATVSLGLGDHRQPDYAAARRRLGWPPDRYVILYLSRVHPKKGLHLLLDALRSLPSPAGRELHLVVVGDGPAEYGRQLREFARAHAANLPPIEWLPAVWGEGKWPLLQGADLFCLPTFSENFGLAVLEACQVGTPPLTTDATPWGDFLASQNLRVTAPAVAALGAELRAQVAIGPWSDDRRAGLARATHKQFGWDCLREEYRQLYRGCRKPPGR